MRTVGRWNSWAFHEVTTYVACARGVKVFAVVEREGDRDRIWATRRCRRRAAKVMLTRGLRVQQAALKKDIAAIHRKLYRDRDTRWRA